MLFRSQVPANISEEDLVAEALAASPVERTLDGREPFRTIVRAPKLVNFVVK